MVILAIKYLNTSWKMFVANIILILIAMVYKKVLIILYDNNQFILAML